MKIIHCSSAKTWRGGEQQIAYLYQELENRNVQQIIYCAAGGAMEAFCKKHHYNHQPYQKRMSFDVLAARQLARLCKTWQPDILHLHDAHSHTQAFISWFFWRNKTPAVLSRRVDFPVRRNWLSLKKYNHPNIRRILTVSKKVKNIIMPSIQEVDKIEVVYSGIEWNLPDILKNNSQQLRKEYQIPATTRMVGNIAALAPHKDYFTFVDTAAILLKRNLPLVFLIIGEDGGEEAKIRAYIEEKQLTDKIILTGFRRAILPVLSELDCLLFTSKEEGLGTSLLDAMASGVPVVATAAGGIPEVVCHRENGLLAPVQSPFQLADLVELVLDREQPIVQKMIKNGKNTARQFSKEKMAEHTCKIYASII